jgi:hypothetical protein
MQLRFNIFNINFFMLITKMQTIEGITSLLPNTDNLHIPMWDFDYCILQSVEKTLVTIQEKWNLSDIYIISDMEGSYRAICFKLVDFRTLMQILWATDYIDPVFIKWTTIRGMATIRFSPKKNRPPVEAVEILKSFPLPIPEKFYLVIYDTELKA